MPKTIIVVFGYIANVRDYILPQPAAVPRVLKLSIVVLELLPYRLRPCTGTCHNYIVITRNTDSSSPRCT
jgi:hypothetical protein